MRLPVELAHRLADRPEEQRWLIDGLWAEEAVGIVGGEPKCCKSFLALEMAVSVAAGTRCLTRFEVARTGPVLLFAAEDALHIVRRRLDGICRARGLALAQLEVHVITAPVLRLDIEEHRQDLAQTVAELRPRLLVLDPFVRLHRIDENASGEVAPLLAFLRELQRRYQLAVVLVHHARKGGGNLRAGQALRGSSEFHAWGDSNLYLRRSGERLTLTVEHRAAPSASGIALELRAMGDAVALQISDSPQLPVAEAPASSPVARLERALENATAPMSVAQLRISCRIRNATLRQLLAELATAGRVRKSNDGYALASR